MPIVDLAHLTRRSDLERSVDFSPVVIGIYLLMRRVAICETCDLYAVIGKYIEMDLAPDELLELDSRYALSPDVVTQLRQRAEDGERLLKARGAR